MSNLQRLFSIMKPALPMMTLAALFSFFTIAANVGLLATSAYLIASAALHPPLAALALSITGVRFFGISRAVFRYGERYISHKATFHILYALRVWFYQRLEPLAPAGLARFRSGDLLGRIVADVDTLQFFYLRVIAPPVVAVAILAAMWCLLGGYSVAIGWLLTVAFLIGGVIVPAALRRLGRQSSQHLLDARADLKASLVDAIQGMAELAAYHQTEQQSSRLAQKASQMSRLQGKAANLSALSEAMNSIIMNVAVWGTLFIAIPLAATGKIEKIYLAVLVLAVQACFEALQPLPLAAYVLEESLAAARRLFALADTAPVVDDQGDTSLVPDDYKMIVNEVSFSYEDGEEPVLHNISFTVPVGKRLAIVGASGAGKTTLVSLLLRFAPYSNGSIKLGSRELTDYHPDTLRNYLAVVSQSTHIFNASLGDNIRLARPSATEEEIKKAARHAAIDDFILSLPQGYDTPAGQNGKSLSGGQRQRLSIARALLKNAPILILDEPTAGLDAVTEQEIMTSIAELMQGRSTILITHRLTGLELFDEILVLDKGRIAQRGTAIELLTEQGLFRKMWQLQRDVLE